MDTNRFDSVSKFFAQRRLSRREALVKGGTAVAATGLAAVGLAKGASAQVATPVPATGTGSDNAEILFVQNFKSGTIAPKEGVDGRYTLTFESGFGQTIYFSDRPDRIVGADSTPKVLDWIGFPDDDPPNAALVVETAPGETDVAVVELYAPDYNWDTGGVTYEIEVLKNWQAELDMEFTEEPTALASLDRDFGAAHLFIDGALDCPDHDFTCVTWDGAQYVAHGTISNAEHDGYCGVLSCTPCKSPDEGGTWADVCNARFPDCNGECDVTPWCVRGVYAWCGPGPF